MSQKTLARAGAVALLALTPVVAQAQGWNGAQPGSISGYNPFSVVGNALVITSGGDTFLTIPNANMTNELLLGIRGVWLVDATGATIAGLTSAGGGTVTGGYTWNLLDNGYVAKRTNGNTENGFPNAGHWISLQSGTVLTKYQKGTGTGYTGGSFSFAPFPTAYFIGIDYLVTDADPTSPTANNGTSRTGRAYFAMPDDRIGDVPEPGEWAAMGVLSTGLAGLALRARRRRSA